MGEILKIHSTESFGAVDGPGIRFVVFFQGCKFRCRFCHNPDTWKIDGGSEISAEELVRKASRYKPYWKEKGGLTASGGEPLLQIEGLTELFRLAKAQGINTALDTAGGPFCKDASFLEKFDELLKYTDLVMLDIKEIDAEKHKNLVGFDNSNVLAMAEYLSEKNVPVWIRHVLVPGISDCDEDLKALREFIDSLSNVEKVEVLPYHSLGEFKWDNLGIEYSLKGVQAPSADRVKNAEEILCL